MRSADRLYLLCALAWAALLGTPTVAAAAPTVCNGVKDRPEFEAAQVLRDVAAFDSDGNDVMSAGELEAYLRACDLAVLAAAEDKRAALLADVLQEAAASARGGRCGDTGASCPFDQVPLYAAQAYAVGRAGDLYVAPKPPTPDTVSPTWTLGRSVTDGANPIARGAVGRGPFVLAYQNNYETDEESGLLLGKATYGPWFFGADDQWDAAVSANFDVDTGGEPEDSAIGFAATATYSQELAGGEAALLYSIAPEYGTDGNGDRDVVSIRAQVSGFGSRFGGAGQWRDLAGGYFTWTPTVAAYCGEVRDAGGSAALEAIEASGSYCRAQVATEWGWQRELRSGNLFTLRLSHGHTLDLEESWDRGYGSFEATWSAKDSPWHLVLLYRKGRREPDFKDIESLTFGIGWLR